MQFIWLYLSLAILTPNTIALLRFDGEPERVCNCFYVYGWNRLYTKFGILKSDWMDEYIVATDMYNNQYIVGWHNGEIIIYDADGNYVETIPADLKQSDEIRGFLRSFGYL